MLFKVIYKNINVRDYLIYFFSCILFVVVTFTLISLLRTNEQIMLGDKRENVRMLFTLYYSIVGFMTLIFMSFSLSFYLRTKSKKLSLLSILGARRSTILLYVLIEYVCIYIISFVSGVLVGWVISKIITQVFVMYDFNVNLSMIQYMDISLETIKVSAIVYFLGFMGILFALLVRKDLSDSLKKGIKRERQYGRLSYIGIVGAILIAWSLMNLREYTVLKMIISLLVCLVGIYIFISFSGGLILQLYAKFFPSNYYKNIIAVNELFYRYKTNKRVIFITLTLNFIVLFIVNGLVVSSLSIGSKSEIEKSYPYDFTIFNPSQNTNLLEEMEVQNYKVIKAKRGYWEKSDAASKSGEYLLCITDHSYNEISENHSDLTTSNALVIYQTSEFLDAYEEQYKHFYVGEVPIKIRNYNSEIITGEDQNIIAIITSEDYKNLDTEEENIIVGNFTNQFAGEANTLLDIGGETYLKAHIVKQLNMEKVTVLISSLFIGLFSSICCLSILGIKVYSELDTNLIKFEILDQLGASQMQRRRFIIKELKILIIVPILVSTVLAWIFMIAEMKYNMGSISMKYVYWIACFQSSCIILQLIYYMFLKQKLVKKIEGYFV